MKNFEDRREQFLMTTDKSRLNIQVIFDFLAHRSYWAQGRPIETIAKSIEHSLCFGIYDANQQAGFARVVTDYATFGYICDLFVLESYRKYSLGKWLIQSIVSHPDLKNIRRLLLATHDAHELYRKYGEFELLPLPERWMTRLREYPTVGTS